MVLCGVSLSVRRGGIAGLRRPARWWTARVALACRCSLTVHSRRSRFAAPLDSGVSPRTHALWYPSMMRLVQLSGRHFPVRRIVICALAGLLVFYHTYTLFDLYFGSGTDLYGGGSGNAYPWFERTQSILRVIIIFSLVFVVMNRRFALYGMWAGISALVATHYWAFFFDLPFLFLDGRHPLSYLKGFIIPTVISLLYFSVNGHRPREPGSASES